jgi:hypothetical protein
MDKFRAPLRIQIVYDQLMSRPELHGCQITIEELPPAKDALSQFPVLDWDTCRVFVRFEDYAVNVVGCLHEGEFQYRANAYRGEEPWDQQYRAEINQADAVVEFVIGKFDLVPRTKPSSN